MNQSNTGLQQARVRLLVPLGEACWFIVNVSSRPRALCVGSQEFPAGKPQRQSLTPERLLCPAYSKIMVH